jgi:hypothetical protein
MGSGGNFARTLTIDAEGHLTAAKGPLNATDDNINLKLYAYVYQTRDNGSGAAFTSELDGAGIQALPETLQSLGEAGDQWIIPRIVPVAKSTQSDEKAIPEQEGIFHPGPATGVALAIARTPKGQIAVTWWTDTIDLVPEDEAGT